MSFNFFVTANLDFFFIPVVNFFARGEFVPEETEFKLASSEPLDEILCKLACLL